METLLGRVRRKAEDFGCFGGGEFFAVAKEKDGAVGVRDEAEGGFDFGGEFVLEELGFGVGIRGGQGEGFVGDFGHGSEDAFAAHGEAAVAGDGEHPGFDPGGVGELRPVLGDFEEGVLGDLFGVFALAAHEPGVLEDFALDGFEEGGEGGLVAGEEAGGKFDFGKIHTTDVSVSTVSVISGVTRRVFLTRHFSAVRRAPSRWAGSETWGMTTRILKRPRRAGAVAFSASTKTSMPWAGRLLRRRYSAA